MMRDADDLESRSLAIHILCSTLPIETLQELSTVLKQICGWLAESNSWTLCSPTNISSRYSGNSNFHFISHVNDKTVDASLIIQSVVLLRPDDLQLRHREQAIETLTDFRWREY